MILATVQARMGSTRVPGKVIREFSGKPMIQHIIERLGRSKLIDEIVVATSDSSSEEPLLSVCRKLGVPFYRGSEQDVLKRLAGLMKLFPSAVHVECFGDSPFVDAEIIDYAIEQFLSSRADIDVLSNTLKTTYPPGMECLVYEGKSLVTVDRMVSKDDPLREHGGYNLVRFPNLFRSVNFEAPIGLYRPNIYLELDSLEDIPLIESIFKYFADEVGTNAFSLKEILAYLEQHPQLARQNIDVHRRWKKLRR